MLRSVICIPFSVARELGESGLQAYLETKTMVVAM
jgi:hypothetical protein